MKQQILLSKQARVLMKQACTFKTEIGYCGLVWVQDEVAGFFLPESHLDQLTQQLKKTSASLVKNVEAPSWVQRLIKQLQKHLAGDKQDFTQVKIRKDGFSPFQWKVYATIQKIPPGKVYSYKEVGMAMGGSKAYRAIGTALGKNPIPVLIPCHRVVGSNSKVGGFSAPGGIKTKLKLLKIEDSKFLI